MANRTISTLEFCPTTVAGLSQWLKELPVANPLFLAERLIFAIRQVNRLNQPASLCFELLDLLSQSAFECQNSFERTFMGQSVILPEKAEQQAKMAQSLDHDLYLGYWSLAWLLMEKNNKKVALLPLCLHRALAYLSAMMLRSFQLYIMPQGQYWSALYQLYACLIECKALTQIGFLRLPAYFLDRYSEFANFQCTAESLFVGISLLGAIEPQAVRQSQLRLVFLYLIQLHPLVKILSETEENRVFYFSLIGQTMPMWPSARLMAVRDENSRYLKTYLLNHYLNNYRLHGERARDLMGLDISLVSPIHLQQDTLDHLLKVMGCQNIRQEEDVRFNKENIQVYVGFFTTCQILDFQKSEVNWQDKIKIQIKEAVLINYSKKGCCVEFLPSAHVSTQIGDLIFFEHDKAWHLYSIRWVKRLDLNRVRMGLHLLGDNPEAVEVYLENHQPNQVRALMIQNFGEKKANYLILPFQKELISLGCVIQIDSKKKPYRFIEKCYKTANFLGYYVEQSDA